MSADGASGDQDLSLALQVLTPKYRKALQREYDEETINRICQNIFDTFSKIPIETIRERKFSFLKFNCFFSTNIV